ncbi:P-II family nitrogen regulator [Methanobacterium paludis]|uniref:Nitrogen regulatory protein P-II n=1 Tax=Methanobacterium paludis (strain DSM 25820 / JCM 18151 / SWAN1) TaxID=868131 RepID=F6D762_METPW|nr:P-II family nitrogen regulator [Methanobacterium paludis]AEG19021.1 nitrogen regulatory protein P-II [Methanobacterium paludis]
MKEILAIIRPNKMTKTKEVLETLGSPAMTAIRVMGRGKQKAILNEVSMATKEPELLKAEGNMRYIPKRMISVVVPDEDTSLIVEAIMKINHTGQIGDGKIFVCPITDAFRVRTKENGDAAIF